MIMWTLKYKSLTKHPAFGSCNLPRQPLVVPGLGGDPAVQGTTAAQIKAVDAEDSLSCAPGKALASNTAGCSEEGSPGQLSLSFSNSNLAVQ
jgi:hypothetical protein